MIRNGPVAPDKVIPRHDFGVDASFVEDSVEDGGWFVVVTGASASVGCGSFARVFSELGVAEESANALESVVTAVANRPIPKRLRKIEGFFIMRGVFGLSRNSKV
jgi:hypothetical protein